MQLDITSDFGVVHSGESNVITFDQLVTGCGKTTSGLQYILGPETNPLRR